MATQLELTQYSSQAVHGQRLTRPMLARFIDHLARAGAEFMTLETALQRFHAYRGP